jgi:beta-glucosidase
MNFPSKFVWGAAAASYQIEGAAYDDGKGPSVWDMFCKKHGTVWNGHSGETACDHYHRYAEDVRLMQSLGLQAYRLSVSWPRVLPDGTGAVNDKGLSFYDRLVDALLAAGIEPHVTLFHWDFPLSLYHRGGWLNRDSADWFAEYSERVVRKLGDRVQHWMTLNEPQVFVGAGHNEGRHAPGDKLRFAEVLRAAHHVLLAHGRSVQAIRAATPRPCRIGFAPVGTIRYPTEETPAAIAAARDSTFSVTSRTTWTNTWWNDPVFLGKYPEDGLKLYGHELPEIRSGDLELIAQPIDFFGVNIYQGTPVRLTKNGGAEVVPHPVGHPITGFDWAVTPDAMYWGCRFLHERYQKPIVITENGISCRDWVSVDGKVHDPQRIDFMKRYLRSLHRAIKEGIPIDAYFHWSIMDNFEWAEGYKQRFGMIFVDYVTQKRTLKDSAHWYRDVIASGGAKVFED